MNDRVDLQEFIGGFVAEAEELIGSAQVLLFEVEAANAEGTLRPRAVRELYRALHTIKGLAGMVGIEPIVQVAHALETLLRTADRNGGRLRRGAVEVSMQGVQAIGEGIRAVADGRTPERASEALLAAIAGTDAASDQPFAPPPIAPEWDARLTIGERQQVFQALSAGSRVWSLTFEPSEANAARGVTIAAVRARLSALGELVKVAPRSIGGDGRGLAFDLLIISEAVASALADAAATTEAQVTAVIAPTRVIGADVGSPSGPEDPAATVSPLGISLVRVELARLDALQDQLSLLIVSRFRLEREIAAQAERGTDVRILREVADLQGRQLRDLRRAILRVRMVRVAEVLAPLSLLVRSLVRPGYKEVVLEIDAQGTEVDKAVADRLLPALVHLIRNAVDHAIESVDERVAAGKARAGTLRVSCTELAGSQLQLVISDDGRGIDRAAIARRANRAIGTDDELLDVLTTPGFSTRDVATQTSGRGLGMDIVKRVAIGELGGELALVTVLGAGTTFRLKVPLTISIIDVFSFECGPQAFVVPVSEVEEIFELVPGAVAVTGAVVSLLERKGQAMPLITLGALLAVDRGDAARKAIVIRRNGELIAFAVDKMRGRHEVVVRPISDPLARVSGISGATDLGDGQPTLVLDLSELGAKLVPRQRVA